MSEQFKNPLLTEPVSANLILGDETLKEIEERKKNFKDNLLIEEKEYK